MGEAARPIRAATPTGPVKAADVDALLPALWPHTHPPAVLLQIRH
ncbi:hypothetical protein [Nocardiopsis sp. CC223A]|nr:hypothetical protein [Nocardiopsis sp. CC223A]